MRLLATLTHDHGVVVSQRRVPGKGGEVGMFAPLLEQGALAGRVVTADAVHTQTEHAQHLVQRRQAAYLLAARGQPVRPSGDHRPPPAGSFPPHKHTTIDREHGRVERRAIWVAPAPAGVRFPHTRQVLVV